MHYEAYVQSRQHQAQLRYIGGFAMNDIIKDPHNIRKGQEWFDMLPKELQARWLFYTSKINRVEFVDFMLKYECTFYGFINASFPFFCTEEGIAYWESIAQGRFGVIKNKKTILSKIINFFKL